MNYSQNGKNFYSEKSGELIFTSSVTVKDGDIEAAKRARVEFRTWYDSVNYCPCCGADVTGFCGCVAE